ncbi:hypothetical protein I4U23_000090 [Adineta vaga]|nr:hypothetical protein I4U23_000090 [Adineta vaga]
MSIISTLVLIQAVINRYGLPIILAFGNIGNLCTIWVYMHKLSRKNSYAIYLIASSVVSLIGANLSIIPIIYALDHYDLVNNSLIFCRIRGYVLQITAQSFRYILVLRCADRYALSNSRVSIRAFSRPQIAYRGIAIVIAVWSVLSAQLLIWESIENGRCGVYGLFGQIFAIYLLILNSLLPLLMMIVFGILLIKNLRELRVRIQPLTNHNNNNNNTSRLNIRDASLMRLVLSEVLVYVFCTFMWPILQIYVQATASMSSSKSAERKQIESFLTFIIQSVLLYLIYNSMFYVHIITSKAFRNEIKQLILVYIRKLQGNVWNHEGGLITVNRILIRQPPQITTTA